MSKGKTPGRGVRGEVGNGRIRYGPRQFVPAKELAEALADIPPIDYDELRADIDATFDDSPKDWWAWAENTDRHVDRRRLEEI